MGHVMYKLGGEARNAAVMLHRFQDIQASHEPPIQYPINLGELGRIGREFYARATQIADKGLLAKLGLDQPVVTVVESKDEYPRAYEAYPQIYTNGGPNADYFMYSPVAHDGTHFKPADSAALDPAQERQAGDALFAGGWSDPISVMPQAVRGVATPDNFIPQGPKGYQPHPYRVFLPGGASYFALKGYASDKSGWDAQADALCDFVRKTILEEAKKTVDEKTAEGMYVNTSYTLNGKFELHMSLCAKYGEKLPMPSGQHYNATQGSHDMRITPLPNPATEAGKIIKDMFDKLPRQPNLGDYNLRAPDGTQPILHSYGAYDFLYYVVDDQTPDFCPADSSPVSRALYQWIRKDHEDACRGVTPPPMPKALEAELDKIRPLIVGGKPAAPAAP